MLLFHYLFTVSLACVVDCIIVLPKDDEGNKCLIKLLRKHQDAYSVVVANRNTRMIECIPQPYVLLDENNVAVGKRLNKMDMFLLILHEQRADYVLETLQKYSFWNSRAKFLITSSKESPSEILNATRRYFIYNAVVLDSGLIYTYYPYGGDSCFEFTSETELGSCYDVLEIFPRKIPNDLHGCEVKLMPYIIPPYVTNMRAPREDPALSGVEVTIVHVVSQRMNFAEKYVTNPFPHWGYRYPNGSYSLMFKSLFNRETDLIFGFTYGNASYGIDFDPSFCHLTDRSVWFFPSALQMAGWKNLTMIFEGRLWLSILIVFLINGTAWFLVGRNREKKDEFNDIVLCVMQSLYVLLQGSVIPPKTWNVRIIFMSWLLSCLLLFTAHQCQLISILTTPLYDKQMQTLSELSESKSEFGFYPTIEDAYNQEPISKLHQYILNRYLPCPLTAECLNRTAFSRDFAVVKNRRQVLYLMPRFYTFPNGRPMLYETFEIAFQTRIRYHAAKGWPLLDRFDNLLMLLEANGLIAKWDIDSRFKVLKIESEPDHEALSLSHLQGAFYIYLLGSFVSTLMFVFERLFSAVRNYRQKTLMNTLEMQLFG